MEMKTVEIKESNGTIQTKRTAYVGKDGRRWAIFGEIFNPVTFGVDRFKVLDLRYPYYRTKKAAEDALSHYGLDSIFIPWYTATRDGVEERAKQFGVDLRWVA